MSERTRTFTGTLPSPTRFAWETAHNAICSEGGIDCDEHENPFPSEQRVLVHVFEEDGEVQGMEAALREGEGRFARWGIPATMAEEAE